MIYSWVKVDAADKLPKVVWQRGNIRVIASGDITEIGKDNLPMAESVIEYNHGPNRLGNDAWLPVGNKDLETLEKLALDLIHSINKLDVNPSN